MEDTKLDSSKNRGLVVREFARYLEGEYGPEFADTYLAKFESPNVIVSHSEGLRVLDELLEQIRREHSMPEPIPERTTPFTVINDRYKSGLLRIRPSAKGASRVVSSEIEKVSPLYRSNNHITRLNEFIYSCGGCPCGCAPEFQFYYDKENLGIVPCFMALDFIEPITLKGQEIVENVQKRLRIPRVDLVMRTATPPDYMAPFMRR